MKEGDKRVLKCDPTEEFQKLLPLLAGSDKWTAGERSNYFTFFCHGWYGRAKEGAWQGHQQRVI